MGKERDIWSFYTAYLFQATIGLITGGVVNRYFEFIGQYFYEYGNNLNFWLYKLLLLFMVFVQLTILFFMMNFIIMYLPYNLHRQWQKTIPGLVFPAIYFGAQTNMFQNIQYLILL